MISHMKKLSLLFLLLALSLGAPARSLVFTLTNGTKVYYLLSAEVNPIVKFEDGRMYVNADKYILTSVKSFRISDEDDPTAIEHVLSERKISFTANTVVVRSGNTQSVKVYAANGVEVEADVQKTDDVVTVDLNGLARGTYIVKVGEASMKVMKK